MNKIVYLHPQSKLKPFIHNHKTFEVPADVPTDAIAVIPISNYITDKDNMIEYVQNTDGHVYVEDCVEGSSTMIRHLDQHGLLQRALNKDISIIASGEMPEQMSAVAINYMMYMTGQVNESHRKISSGRKNKPYTFLFLNNRIRRHRTKLIQDMLNLDLLDSALWSNVCMDKTTGRLPTPTLPKEYDPQTGKDLIDWDTWAAGPVIKKQYQHTYFSVFAESSVTHRYAFPTEKTWKPIIAGHPFMALANIRNYPYLQELGFQTFDGIIDETWAGMTLWTDASTWLSNQVKKVCDGDLVDFQAQCRKITAHNKKQFWALYDSYIADTQAKISQLFEQVE